MILPHFVKDTDDQCGERDINKNNILGLDNELEAEQTNSERVSLSFKEIALFCGSLILVI